MGVFSTKQQNPEGQVTRFNGTWNGGMEQWNGGIVEWATMTNDPVPHHSFARAHYAAQSQSQKGERDRNVDSEKDREAKAIGHMLIV